MLELVCVYIINKASIEINGVLTIEKVYSTSSYLLEGPAVVHTRLCFILFVCTEEVDEALFLKIYHCYRNTRD